MFVRDYMTRHPIMVEPDTSILEVQGIMSENNIRHVPVVETGKRLVGLVTRQNLRVSPIELASLNVWEITRRLSSLRVSDVMVRARDIITIGPDTPIEEAAHLMVKRKVGCLPVVEDGAVPMPSRGDAPMPSRGEVPMQSRGEIRSIRSRNPLTVRPLP